MAKGKEQALQTLPLPEQIEKTDVFFSRLGLAIQHLVQCLDLRIILALSCWGFIGVERQSL